VKEQGDGQTATAGLPVAIEPQVRVTDEFGNAIEGMTVTFAVASGGGSATGTTPATDADGLASVGSWTLGPNPGTNELTASVTGVTPVTFEATGVLGAANITIAGGNNQSATVATAVPAAVSVRLTDSNDDPVEGQEVIFAVTGGGGTVTGATTTSDADGLASVGSWTLGTVAGENTLSAQTEALDPVTFTATGTADAAVAIAIEHGDGQTGLVDFGVNIPPSVLLTDQFGNPAPGGEVTFTAVAGGGSVIGGTTTSDDDGIAVIGNWVLGATPGMNTLDATLTGDGTVSFTATGVAGAYDIEVRFLTEVTAAQEQVFLESAARWGELVYGDLTDITIDQPAGFCGSNSPATNETIDDLLIFATVEPIDGAGGILGQAGPCLIRSANSLPLAGLMRFDEADLDNLESAGHLDEVILHEMAHVMGLGVIWDNLGFLVGAGTSDPHFVGPRAIEGFDRIGGDDYAGNKVPVANTGGAGTRDSHWRESVLDNELMTGFLNGGQENPLSELTTGSFWDLGYTVNLDGSDAFSIDAGLHAGFGTKIRLVDDIARVPIRVVDSSGRTVQIIDW
jgi:hypothetical protein